MRDSPFDVVDAPSELHDLIVANLTSLRRFGYLLTNSATRADEAIAGALRRIVKSPSLLTDAENGVVPLFQMVIEELEKLSSSAGDVSAEPSERTEKAFLRTLTREERQFFLLRFVEELDVDVVTAIVGGGDIDPEEFESKIANKTGRLEPSD